MNSNSEKNKEALINELIEEANLWQAKTFNNHQLEVIEHWANRDNEFLIDYIVNPSVEYVFLDWIDDTNHFEIIDRYLTEQNKGMEEIDREIEEFYAFEGDTESSLIHVFGQKGFNEFKLFCCDQYYDDINDFIEEQENYPLWNTIFEFKTSDYNNMASIQKCVEVGLGAITELEPFNNMVFMTSGGHSFISSYWIPLYLALNVDAAAKYSSLIPSDYEHA